MFLEMKNITKTFGMVRALDNVNLTVENAEIHGLLGENGAGKSTLMNILAGTFQPSQGEIYLDGEKVEGMTTRKSFALGIRFIHQELNLINDLKVYENMFLGMELKNKFGTLDKKMMRKKSKDVLQKMKINIDPDEMVEYLDTANKQLIEIAKALLFESKLIIMDEPTTALTSKEIKVLFEIMKNLKQEGVSLIYISHKMPELFEICDKYTVLRDGKWIETGCFKDIDEKKATELLVGRSFTDDATIKEKVTVNPIFSVKDFTCKGVFNQIHFELNKGEVLVITGLQGDGRGELAEALFGDRKIDGGTITINGRILTSKTILSVMRSGIGMVPRNRKERSIIKDMSIMDNLSMAHFTAKHKKIFVNKKEERQRFERNQRNMAIKVGSPEDEITSLSGGNQQKVIISRWLELDSDVFILDNPTQGIDVGAKFEIYKIINALASTHGKSLIVFSSEFPEIYKIADRCLIMYKGEINAELDRDKLTDMNVMYYATGSNLEEIR